MDKDVQSYVCGLLRAAEICDRLKTGHSSRFSDAIRQEVTNIQLREIAGDVAEPFTLAASQCSSPEQNSGPISGLLFTGATVLAYVWALAHLCISGGGQ